jgi:hypothetical protein
MKTTILKLTYYLSIITMLVCLSIEPTIEVKYILSLSGSLFFFTVYKLFIIPMFETQKP